MAYFLQLKIITDDTPESVGKFCKSFAVVIGQKASQSPWVHLVEGQLVVVHRVNLFWKVWSLVQNLHLNFCHAVKY